MSQRRIVLSIDVEARSRILGEMPLLQHEMNGHVTYNLMILSIRSRSRLFRQPNHGQERTFPSGENDTASTSIEWPWIALCGIFAVISQTLTVLSSEAMARN